MRSFLSILLSVLSELLPFVKSGEARGWISGVILILANMIPLAGIYFFGWSPWFILFLYWGESLIIGLFNIIKIILSGAITAENRFNVLGLLGSLFIAAFFCVHYGGFMAGHLIFLLVIYVHFVGADGFSLPGQLTVSMFDEAGSAADIPGIIIKGLFTFDGPMDFLDSEMFAVAAPW